MSEILFFVHKGLGMQLYPPLGAKVTAIAVPPYGESNRQVSIRNAGGRFAEIRYTDGSPSVRVGFPDFADPGCAAWVEFPDQIVFVPPGNSLVLPPRRGEKVTISVV